MKSKIDGKVCQSLLNRGTIRVVDRYATMMALKHQNIPVIEFKTLCLGFNIKI